MTRFVLWLLLLGLSFALVTLASHYPDSMMVALDAQDLPALLVRAGARADSESLDANAGRRDLAERIRSDPRMQAALRGEMGASAKTLLSMCARCIRFRLPLTGTN